MLSLEILESRALLSVSEPSGSVDTASHQADIAGAGVGPLAPQAASVAPITSVHDGLWSDPNSWSGAHVPAATDDVVIRNNITIDHAQVHELDINAGTATLAGDLQAYASVIVRSQLVGSQGSISFHVSDDRLFTGNTSAGPDPTARDFHPEDIGLWALSGASVDLEGAQVTSWVNAVGTGVSQSLGRGVTQQVAFAAGTATLQSAPSGWRTGDTLLLVNEQGQSVLADLTSVNGTSLQYHEHKAQPTDPSLVGHMLVTAGTSTVAYSKIANLTRRIQIVGADVHEGDTNHRASTNYLAGSTAKLVNVEFRDLGPRGIQGRYPVYFDQGGAVTSSLTGSSIWQDVTDPGNRFVAIRGVQGLTVASNVAFRSQGDGFFMEDGSEYADAITGNLSVQVSGGEELPNVNSTVTDLSHHFWLRTGNTISGNVAAGGDAVGMIVLASTHPATTVVAGFQAFGTGLYGMWTATPNVTFDNPVAVNNSRAGFASDPAWDVDSHGTTLNNPLFLFNGTSDSDYGSQIFLNDSGLITVNGGVLAGVKAVHTHYHSAFVVANSQINVDTLLTPTYWEQAGTFDHDSIHAALLFERAYPSPRYTSPGIVHFVGADVQIGNAPAEEETADYMGDTFQNYPALQGSKIPNAIELSQSAPSGFIRVTPLSDDDRWMTNIQRWTVTPIGQTPLKDSFIYHRQTAWQTLAGLGGWPDGFPPGQYAVSLYTGDGVFLKSGFAVVQSGQVADLTDTLPGSAAQVVGRQLFYNNSKYDGNGAGLAAADDAAIATDKSAYVAGGSPSTFANVSSYDRGINGVMVDLQGSGNHTAITLAGILNDFKFQMGNNNAPGSWAAAPAPTAVLVRPGAGLSGSDRVELRWADGAIKNQWLEVTVKAGADTGLAGNDVFFFGSEVGDTGFANTAAVATVGAGDVTRVQINVSQNAPITSVYDFNRDGQVGSSDVTIAQSHTTNNSNGLRMLNSAAGGPLAAAPLPDNNGPSAVASALAAGPTSAGPSTLPAPGAIDGRPSQVAVSRGPIVRFLMDLATADVGHSASISNKTDLLDASAGLDDELLAALVAVPRN